MITNWTIYEFSNISPLSVKTQRVFNKIRKKKRNVIFEAVIHARLSILTQSSSFNQGWRRYLQNYYSMHFFCWKLGRGSKVPELPQTPLSRLISVDKQLLDVNFSCFRFICFFFLFTWDRNNLNLYLWQKVHPRQKPYLHLKYHLHVNEKFLCLTHWR